MNEERELTEAELAAVSGGIKDFPGTYALTAPRDASSGQWSLGASNPYKAAQAEGLGN
jgi:bacteriocin-like protein